MAKRIRILVEDENGQVEMRAEVVGSEAFNQLKPPNYGLRQVAEEFRRFLPEKS